MLLQSHAGEVSLLPALPTAWPTGSVSGLRARGGYEVSMRWQSGRLDGATLRATLNSDCTVRVPKGHQIREVVSGGEAVAPEPTGDPRAARFRARAGNRYEIRVG